MFGCLFYPRVCSSLMTQRGVVFMQMRGNQHSLPRGHPLFNPLFNPPPLLAPLAPSTTLWSPASCEWSITTGSGTRRMMGHRPPWQPSPGSFFKRQRSTSEPSWGRVSEVRWRGAGNPSGGVMGRRGRTHKSADVTRLAPTRRGE